MRDMSPRVAVTLVLLAALVAPSTGCKRAAENASIPQIAIENPPVITPALPADPPKPEEQTIPPPHLPREPKHGEVRPYVYNRVVALCIGIDNYESPRTDHAADAERDALSMADLFKRNYGYEVVTLIGKDATKKRILAEIEKYKAVLGDNEALLIFFSGHGQVIDLPSYDRAGYLVPYDADLSLRGDRNAADWEHKAVSMAGLTEGVAGAKAQHVLFIVNACCSGFMANRGLAARTDIQQLMTRRSRAVIAASTENQVAVAGGGSRFGHFVTALREKLSKAEAVSAMEVFVPVREYTARESKGTMLPQLGRFGTDDGEFVFIPKSLDPGEVTAAVRSIEALAKLRDAQWTKAEHLYDLLDPTNHKTSPRRAELERVWELRLARFRTNAGLGDPLALVALTLCYQRGFGMNEPDPATAEVYAGRALATKRPEGKFARGFALLGGPGKNELAARDLLTQASGEGVLLANVVLADSYLTGRPTAADVKRADELLEQAEAGGIPAAGVRRVALSLKAGLPAADERVKLVARLTPVADAGIALAQYLTYELITGGDVAPDKEQKAVALRRLAQAAEAGYAEAQFRLAAENYQREWYQGRLGLKQDFVAARIWATAASEQGHFHAKKILAMIYISGDGVEPSLAEAKKYFDQTFPGPAPDVAWVRWYQQQIQKLITTPKK